MRINPVYFVRTIIAVLVGLDLYWAWRADRRLRVLPWAGLWRSVCAAFIAAELGCLLLVLFDPHAVRGVKSVLPTAALAAVYLWHLLILPITLLLGFAGRLVAFLGRLTRSIVGWQRRPDGPTAPPPNVPPSVVQWRARGHGLPPVAAAAGHALADATATPASPLVFTRRKVLGAAAVAAPVLALGGGVWKGLSQIGQFRRRDLTLSIPQLPAALDGLTIAHVSDLHVGRFMRPALLPAVVDAVNGLDADLVLLTGDLIDFSIDDLPVALDAVRRMRSRHGLAMCLGNHDLIEDPKRFVAETRAAGVRLLVDEAHDTLFIRRDTGRGTGAIAGTGGRWAEVQLLGTSWSGHDAEINDLFNTRIVPTRSPTAFPIVLAHHPHAFDPAAAAGFPLILSGHTHGGQLMATRTLGAGPLMFRYWSGLYTKGVGPTTSQLVVSNGVGNWFPLRINAPAEIARLTLTQAALR